MADACGNCKYFDKSACPKPQNDKDHKPCSDFKKQD